MQSTKLKMSPGAGCLAKLPALELQDLLQRAYKGVSGKSAWHPMQSPEDCLSLPSEGDRLLATTDFGPLVGVDAADAGRIAALHAMSDIYASGGMPKWALAVVILENAHSDSSSDFREQLLGSLIQTCREEEVEVGGGHTIIGRETMVGLTVIGTSPNGVALKKTGGRVGDRLLLSKPVGLGIAIKARQLDLIGDEHFTEALDQMRTSNKEASRHAVEAGVRAATDVSGFGLLGHLSEMLGPEQGAILDLARIPFLRGIEYLDLHLAEPSQGLVRFLLLDPKSKAFDHLNLAATHRGGIDGKSIKELKSLSKTYPCFQLKLYCHVPCFRLCFVDDIEVSFAPYRFYGGRTFGPGLGQQAPHLLIRRGPDLPWSLYDTLNRYFEQLWSAHQTTAG